MNNENRLEDLLKTLNFVNYQIAELKEIKEKLERDVIELSGRASFIRDDEGKYIMTNIVHEGLKSHYVGKFKFEIKTDYNVSINKQEYEIGKCILSKEFNPVVEKISLSINNKLLKEVEKYGSEEDKLIIQQFIVKTPAKPYINIKANS